jgi:hypothetical protein
MSGELQLRDGEIGATIFMGTWLVLIYAYTDKSTESQLVVRTDL